MISISITRVANRKFIHSVNSGVASILGQATLNIKNFIFQCFPHNYFKDYFITTKLANLDFARADHHKKTKPYVILKPRFSLEPSNLFGDLYEYHSAYYFRREMNWHHPIFADSNKFYYIYCINDRLNITFDIEYVCNTTMEQLNLAYNLKSAMPHKRPFELQDQVIEVEVPKAYIKYLALINGFIDEEKQTFDELKFQNYLDSNSQYAITKKRKTSSGRYEYFFNFHTNFYVYFDNLPNIDESNKESMVELDARITDSCMVSLWAPMNFGFEHRDPTILYTRDILYEDPYYKSVFADDMLQFIPGNVFIEDHVNIIAPEKIVDGRKLIYDFAYEVDNLPEDGIEKINISEICKEGIVDVVWYLKKYRLDFNEYFKIIIFDFEDRIPDEDISVEWNDFTIYCKNFKNKEKYHVCIYADVNKVIRVLRSIERIKDKAYQIDDSNMNNLFVNLFE